MAFVLFVVQLAVSTSWSQQNWIYHEEHEEHRSLMLELPQFHRYSRSPMTEGQPNREAGERARSLRTTQTVSEGLLWSVL